MIIKLVLFIIGLFTLPFGVFFWILAVLIGNKPQEKKESDLEKITRWTEKLNKRLDEYNNKKKGQK